MYNSIEYGISDCFLGKDIEPCRYGQLTHDNG